MRILKGIYAGLNKKKDVLLSLTLALALILIVSVSTTLAILMTQTDIVANQFTPGDVPITVSESFDGTTKNNVKVTNNGEAPAYVRAFVNITYVQTGASNRQHSTLPARADYNISWTMKDWVKGADGYHYYTKPVMPGQSTGVLFTGASLKAGKAPSGYTWSIDVIAQSIQADGYGTVTVNGAEVKKPPVLIEWGSAVTAVAADGSLTIEEWGS